MSLFGDLFHITFKYLLDITLGHLPPPRNDERDPLQILQRGTLGAPLCPQVLRPRALPWDQVPGAEVLSPEVRPVDGVDAMRLYLGEISDRVDGTLRKLR